MMRQIKLLFGLIACAGLPCVAGAQNPLPAPPQEPHPVVAPPNETQTPPEQIAPEARTPGAKNDESLSDRLSRQQGTLHPPAVDPGIHAGVPSQAQGTMPVIPPPGTPGGNQTVVPK